MKNHSTKVLLVYLRRCIPFVVFSLAIGISFFFNFIPGIQTAQTFQRFFFEMALFVPPMFILIGLIDVWVPRSTIERHIGKESGIKGSVWVIFLTTLQAGPLYSSFPVAYLLWKKGCSPFNVFVYLGAFSSMKLPMLTFEIGFLGWEFSLLRTLLSLPVFIASAWLIDKSLATKEFIIYDGGTKRKLVAPSGKEIVHGKQCNKDKKGY
jgi:uncharacterized membrane protein YraQ (UPF0718 family)